MSTAIVLLHHDDDVAVAIRDLPAGEAVSEAITARVEVPRGHKIAVRDIPAGTPVCKFGQPIGTATSAIAAGDHVHVHNLGMPDDNHDLTLGEGSGTPAARSQRVSGEVPTFEGIRRPDGRVATRNYLVVLCCPP